MLLRATVRPTRVPAGVGVFFMSSSNSRTYFSCAQHNLHPPQVEASSGSIGQVRHPALPRQRSPHIAKCAMCGTPGTSHLNVQYFLYFGRNTLMLG